MTFLKPTESKDLAYGYMVANTPASLYSWLRRHPAVLRAADKLSEDELIDALLESALKESRTEVDVAQAYGFLVALCVRRQRKGPLGALPVSPMMLHWTTKIWERATLDVPKSTTLVVDAVSDVPEPEINERPSGSAASVLLNQFGAPLTIRRVE